MREKLTFSRKLTLSFGMVIVLTMVLGFIGWRNMSAIGDQASRMYGEDVIPTANIAEASTYAVKLSRNDYRIVTEIKLDEANKLVEHNAEYLAGIKESIEAFEKGGLDAAETKVLQQYREDMEKYSGSAKAMHALIIAGKKDEALKELPAVRSAFDKVEESLTSLLKGNLVSAKEKNDKVEAIYASARVVVGLLLALVLGISVLLAWYITRSTTKVLGDDPAVIASVVADVSTGKLDMRLDPDKGGIYGQIRVMVASLNEKARIADAVADGDLTKDVVMASADDTLGAALKKMTDDLNEIMVQIGTSVGQVTAGAGQIAAASQSMSQGATTQAASLEEISSAVTEMTGRVRQNASNAVKASELADKAREAAEGGKTRMAETLAAMTDITTSSQQISKIIKVIDDIAFQTNLLALNAAVEAARAGAHGKGFAVVADEVRNLAGRSAKAAKETAELIEGSVRKVENGLAEAQRTSESFGEIVHGVVTVADLLGGIATASNEQATTAGQIAQSVASVSQVVQQSTASTEETAAAAEELSGQAVQLSQAVGRFRVRGGTMMNQVKPTLPKTSVMKDNGPKMAFASKPVVIKKTPSTAPSMAPSMAPAKTPVMKASSSVESLKTPSMPTIEKPWGGSIPAHVPTSDPVIALDDAEFDKYGK